MAASYAQQVAETYAEIVTMKAEMAQYLADAQEAAKRAEEAQKAAEAAELGAAKFYALTELANYAASAACPEHQQEAMAEAVDAGKAAIEQAADKEAVLAALETAKGSHRRSGGCRMCLGTLYRCGTGCLVPRGH